MLPLHTDMNCHSSISVAKILGITLHTREAADLLVQQAADSPCDEIELNFEAVEFISRSFAHQFHNEKMAVAASKNKVIIVTNASEAVLSMLQTIAKAERVSRKYTEATAQVFKFTGKRQLERMLLAF